MDVIYKPKNVKEKVDEIIYQAQVEGKEIYEIRVSDSEFNALWNELPSAAEKYSNGAIRYRNVTIKKQ